MKLIGIKTPKPRQFSYKPVFFDPEKEEREKLQKQVGEESDIVTEGSRLKEKLERSWRVKEKIAAQRKSRLNLLIAIFIIVLLLYFIFFL